MKMKTALNILVCNDDGITARGIDILAKSLKKYGNVYVVAPNGPRSASSHAIYLHKPLLFKHVNVIADCECYITDGMPADCVRLATSILDIEFDVVFSGVNNGLNVGTDTIYSGTVAVAREAFIEGIPSVAISTDVNCFDIVNNELDNVLEYVFDNKLYSKDYILNINFPTNDFKESKGMKWSNQGIKNFKTHFKKIDEDKYIDCDDYIQYDTNENSDVYLSITGYISLVPLGIDQTNYNKLEEVK
ncbi:MAG: 5'/3'-nucleotidase SurE [Acholeplasmatales bacterium]|nr:5'/3'-nucleotidase SurE [Acholeplasmatales bacterium]